MVSINKKVLVFLILLILIVIYSFNSKSVEAFKTSGYRPIDENIKLMTYNIRHGVGKNGVFDLHKTIDVIERNNPDILALNEVDYLSPRSEFQKQPNLISDACNYNMIYAPTLNLGFKYGNALLTRFDILSWQNYNLPGDSVVLEPRNMIEAQLNIKNEKVMVYATHLSTNHPIRIQQVDYILDIIGHISLPIIFMGDLNAKINSEEMDNILKILKSSIIYKENNKDLIDHIFVSEHFETLEAKSIESDASDHEPVAAKVILNK